MPVIPTEAGHSRLRGLDSIRGIAALLVLSAHVGSHMAPGSIAGPEALVLSYGNAGLTVFFVLSGFLLFSPFASSILEGRKLPSIRAYLFARACRIYPAYLAVFLIAQFVLRSLNQYGIVELHPGNDVGAIGSAPVFVANLLLVQSLVPGMIGTGILPAWSLTAEISFYVALPLLALSGAALAKRHVPRPLAALACAISPLLVGAVTCSLLAHASIGSGFARPFLFSWGTGASAVVERSLLAQSGLFALGMVAAWFVAWRRRSLKSISSRTRARMYCCALIAVIYGVVGEAPAAVLFGRQIGFAAFYLAWHLQGVAAAAILILIVTPRPDGRSSRLAMALDRPLLVGVGTISYGIYLWHMPVISWLVIHHLVLSGGWGELGNLAIVAAIAAGLSYPTYLLIERPAMKLRRRLRVRAGSWRLDGQAQRDAVNDPAPELSSQLSP